MITKDSKNSIILILIALLYIFCSGAEYYSSRNVLHLLCLGSCGRLEAFTRTLNYYLSIGLLLLSFVESVGLFSRQHWARITGVTVGIIIGSISAFPYLVRYLEKGSYPELSSIAVLLIAMPIFAAGFLAFPPIEIVWENKGMNSRRAALILSIFVIGLLAAKSYYYRKTYLENKEIESSGRTRPW